MFLRRFNVALVVYPLRKTINCLLTARPFAAASFAWLMSTQLGKLRPRRPSLAGLQEDRARSIGLRDLTMKATRNRMPLFQMTPIVEAIS